MMSKEMIFSFCTVVATIFTSFLAIVGTFVVILYLYFQHVYKYWDKLGIEVAGKPTFPFGNMRRLFLGKGNPGQIFSALYNNIQGPYAGVFLLHKPALIIKDPEYVKCILVKDFNFFMDRGIQTDIKREPLTNHLFMLKGQKWRNLRNKLSPTFTSGKLKIMFPTLVDCGHELQKALQVAAKRDGEIEIKDYVARFTTDIISSVAFGIKTNSVHNPKSEFREFGRQIFEASLYKSVINGLIFVAPELVRFLRAKFIPKNSAIFFTNALKETIEHRENNKIIRNDFLQLLIQLKNKGVVTADDSKSDQSEYEVQSEDGLPLDQVLAQSFVFFIAGFETSSSTMTFCLYEMALNPDIQAKLQEEIDHVLAKHGGEVTYDSIVDMNYLDNVVSETLRKYPVLELLNRQAVMDYKMPNSDFIVKKGTMIMIPVRGLQHDPNHFPNPNKFDPDRFLPENKTWDPYCYIPFGEGPRNCIGARMGKMQTKIGLISILRDFNVNVCSRTPIPMTFSKRQIILTSENEVVLKITRRK